jgi:hypothetical protein
VLDIAPPPKSSACPRYSGDIGVDVAEMMVGRASVRDVATNAKWKAISDPT